MGGRREGPQRLPLALGSERPVPQFPRPHRGEAPAGDTAPETSRAWSHVPYLAGRNLTRARRSSEPGARPPAAGALRTSQRTETQRTGRGSGPTAGCPGRLSPAGPSSHGDGVPRRAREAKVGGRNHVCAWKAWRATSTAPCRCPTAALPGGLGDTDVSCAAPRGKRAPVLLREAQPHHFLGAHQRVTDRAASRTDADAPTAQTSKGEMRPRGRVLPAPSSPGRPWLAAPSHSLCLRRHMACPVCLSLRLL